MQTLITLGDSVQEGEDVFLSDLIEGTVTILDKPFEYGLVGSYRIILEQY